MFKKKLIKNLKKKQQFNNKQKQPTNNKMSLFTQTIEVLQLPKHDFTETPMKAIWQDYFDTLEQWENQKKETDYVYTGLALQIEINMLPLPETIPELNIPNTPKEKLKKAVKSFKNTIKMFKEGSNSFATDCVC